MNPFGVSEAKARDLAERLHRLGVREEDLEESFIRSRGPGGQNVNKVSTCVVLKHRPSGIEVRVQRERSQALNRFLARRLLADRLEEAVLGRLSAERRRIYRIRRQKQRRSRRTQQKLLAAKRLHSLKKQKRRRPSLDE